MPRTHISLVATRGWLLIILVGAACFAAGLAVLGRADASVLPNWIGESIMLALLGLSVAGAFVIHRQRQQNKLLTAALDNMPQGLCMLDGSGRLLLCNERYLEIYRLTPAQAVPGCSLRDLLEHCQAVGTFSGNADRYAAECMARIAQGKLTSTAFEMKDGRIVALANRPIPGGGWIDTHEDITERRRAALQRSSMQEHAQRQAALEEAIRVFRQRAETLLKSN